MSRIQSTWPFRRLSSSLRLKSLFAPFLVMHGARYMRGFLSATVLFALIFSSSANAGSATFKKVSAKIVTKGTNVADFSVFFAETGLAPNSIIQYQLDANGSATFICESAGALASGPTTVSGFIAHVYPSSTSNRGGTLQTTSLDEISGPTCSGSTRRIVSVAYDSAEICDQTNGVCQPLGTLSITFCDPTTPTSCPVT